MQYPTYLSSRSSASNVGFCWAFSGVGWEACSCSRRRRWISCRISLDRMEDGHVMSYSSLFLLEVFTLVAPPLPILFWLLLNDQDVRQTDTFLILLHLIYSIKQSFVVEKAVSTTKYRFQELEKKIPQKENNN